MQALIPKKHSSDIRQLHSLPLASDPPPPHTHTSAVTVCVCVNLERNVNKQSAKDNKNNRGTDLKRRASEEKNQVCTFLGLLSFSIIFFDFQIDKQSLQEAVEPILYN